MLRSTRSIAVTAAVAAAVAGLAACGSKTVSPQQQLDNSFSGLAAKSSLTSTIRFALSSTDLAYFAKTDSSDSPATAARIVKLLPTSSFVISTATDDGKALKTLGQSSKDDNTSLALILGGKSDVEFRVLGKTGILYARADVNDLVTQGGGDPSKIQAELSQAPASLSFVKTAASGGWVNIDLAAAEALAKQFPGATGTTGGVATPNPTQAAAAEAQLIDTLERDVTATQGPSSNLGNHLILTANSKAVVNDITGAIKTLVPAALQSTLSKDLDASKVPSRTVTLDAYTKNGTLSALQIDLAQFASGDDATTIKGHHIPLEIDFNSTGAKIAAPATSSTINLQQIIQAFTSQSTTS